MIDATEGITEQDQKLASLSQRYGKGLIVLFNKWDLVDDPEKRYKELITEFERELHFVSYAPILTVSGVTKKRLTKVFPIIDEVIKERRRRIPTPELNRFASEITPMLPTYKGKRTKIYYITQPEIEPPGFVIFVNYPAALKSHHIRFIEKRLREKYTFRGTPIEIKIRKKS
jgi:GTP-binding protein